MENDIVIVDEYGIPLPTDHTKRVKTNCVKCGAEVERSAMHRTNPRIKCYVCQTALRAEISKRHAKPKK